MNKDFYKPCKLNPENHGIDCRDQNNCEKCGWNPKNAKRIHEATRRNN